MEITGTMTDATLDSAVESIMKKIPDEAARIDVNGNDVEEADARDNRDDRDVTEREGTGDLEEAERQERAAKGDGETGADDAGADEEFIELPATEDGKEAERIPLAEAVEAVKKLRQMDGDIATAVIKAEEDAFGRQDKITQALENTFKTVRDQGQVALQLMQQFLPQMPDERMLNEGPYFDPAGYWKQRNYYDAYVDHYHKVAATVKQAEGGLSATSTQQDQEVARRENERASRYIPEFRADDTRAAKKAEIVKALGKYGLTEADANEITDHRAWRVLHDLAQLQKQKAAAPEVRKAVQDKAPKITKGRTNPSRDAGTGRFVTDARKQLKESGSEAAFAAWALRSGLVE